MTRYPHGPQESMGAAVVSRQLSSVSASIKELLFSRPLGGREVWMIPKQKTIGSDVGIQRQILSRSQIYAAISPCNPFPTSDSEESYYTYHARVWREVSD